MVRDQTKRRAAGGDRLRATLRLVQDRREVRPGHRLRGVDREKLAIPGLGERVVIALMMRQSFLEEHRQGGAGSSGLRGLPDTGLAAGLGSGHAEWGARWRVHPRGGITDPATGRSPKIDR